MKYLVRCGWRIGDILMQLPALKYLSDQGHQVFVYCLPEYHSLFDLVSYASLVEGPSVGYDRHLDLQIYPDRQPDFKRSGVRLVEYVYRLYPDIEQALRTSIVFDRDPDDVLAQYQLSEEYFLLAPFGYSQSVKPTLEWMLSKFRELTGPRKNVLVLSDKDVPHCPCPVLTASRLSHLPSLIREAKEFFTVNSSPSIFASVVRNHYYHLFQPDWNGTHDWKSSKQTVIYHDEWPRPAL